MKADLSKVQKVIIMDKEGKQQAIYIDPGMVLETYGTGKNSISTLKIYPKGERL